METTEIVNIFSTFGFPTAMVIVMGYALWKIWTETTSRNKKAAEEALKLRDQYIAYIQMSNVELTGALKENAVALKENAAALKETASTLNRFSVVMERLEGKLKISD